MITSDDFLEILETNFDGDVVFLSNTLKSVENSYSQIISNLCKAVDRGDHTEIHLHAHKLKNRLRYFGKSDLFKELKSIEIAAKHKTIVKDDIEFQALKRRCAEFLSGIKAHL